MVVPTIECSLTCAVQLRTMLRAEGVNGKGKGQNGGVPFASVSHAKSWDIQLITLLVYLITEANERLLPQCHFLDQSTLAEACARTGQIVHSLDIHVGLLSEPLEAHPQTWLSVYLAG